MKIKKLFILSVSVLLSATLYGQSISGTVFEKNNEIPVEYVNIGIVGKNVGTVSDQNGRYSLHINPEYHNDTLRFSSIGYHSYSVKISDLINLKGGNVSLEKRIYDLTEVVIRPKKFRQKRLGITLDTKVNAYAFSSGTNGGQHEIGILIHNKNTVIVKEVSLNVSIFDCDTVFFRLNFYKPLENMQFENIFTHTDEKMMERFKSKKNR